MKSIIALALSLVMILSFASCANNDKDKITPNLPGSGSASVSTPDNSTPDSKSTVKAPAADYVRGTWNENVYNSDFLQLTYTLPEGWVSASDEEMANIFQVVIDDIANSNPAVSGAADKSRYEFLVQDPVTGTNISLVMENISGTIGASLLSEQAYYEIVKKQLEAGGLEGVEFKSDGDLTEVTVKSNKYYYAGHTLTTQGTEISQFLLLRKVGDYMVVATFTCMNGESIEDLLVAFS